MCSNEEGLSKVDAPTQFPSKQTIEKKIYDLGFKHGLARAIELIKQGGSPPKAIF